MKKNDPKLIAAVGDEALYQALWARRKELAGRALTFHVRGISNMILKQQKLKALLQTIGIVAQNQMLLQAFMQKVDPGKLLDALFSLQEIDIDKLGLTPREQMMKELTQRGEATAGPMGQPAPQLSDQPTQGQGAGEQTGAPGGRAPQSAPAQGGTPPQMAQDMLAKLASGG